jgi:XTP/dITP diphosphohydrolase/tetrapyrrole methylase family protein/MazG family protein
VPKPSSEKIYSDKIYEDAFTEAGPSLEAYADFVAIVRQLRRDCPWDREQTHESVRHLLIEEAYETVEAIDAGDWDGLKKELGDILLHVVFHATIAAQDGRFTLKDVIDAETDKLVRRHPHVFGDASVSGTGEVLANWEQIKMQEKDGAGRTRKSVLEGVPAALPSLLRAYRVQQKAAGVGFDFPTAADAWGKVEEEMREFREATEASGAISEADSDEARASDEAHAERERELGDVLFALVNYARAEGLNPENALRATTDRFTRRFQHVERRLEETGQPFSTAPSLETMDTFWDEAKAAERG